jgi:hypothetical protein
MPHYYVEMSNSPNTTTNNHEENQLVVDLKDVHLESKDLISSNQSEEVGLAHLLSLPTLPTRKRQGATNHWWIIPIHMW